MILQVCIGPFCFSLCHIVPLLLVLGQFLYKHIAKLLGLEKGPKKQEKKNVDLPAEKKGVIKGKYFSLYLTLMI